MITTGFPFIAVIVGLCGFFVWIEQQYPSRLFRWLQYRAGDVGLDDALLNRASDHSEVVAARDVIRGDLIPAMLFLMSLRFDLGIIRKLGTRLILLMLGSTATVMIGFVVAYFLIGSFLGGEAPETLYWPPAGRGRELCCGQTGTGGQDATMAYTMVMGVICYSLWLMMIIALKPFKERLNSFLRAEDKGLDEDDASLRLGEPAELILSH